MNPTPIYTRLDMFIISNCLNDIVDTVDICPSFKTDHALISLDLNLDYRQKGKGFWNLICSHLKDPSFVEKINSILTDAKDKYKELILLTLLLNGKCIK